MDKDMDSTLHATARGNCGVVNVVVIFNKRMHLIETVCPASVCTQFWIYQTAQKESIPKARQSFYTPLFGRELLRLKYVCCCYYGKRKGFQRDDKLRNLYTIVM